MARAALPAARSVTRRPASDSRARGRGAARERGRVHGVERSGNQRVEVGVEL